MGPIILTNHLLRTNPFTRLKIMGTYPVLMELLCFFLEYAGELRIFVLRRRIKWGEKTPVQRCYIWQTKTKKHTPNN